MASEKTSSNSTHRLNYTLWKALAELDHVSEYLCVTMSLPFVYKLVNKGWLKMIDAILKKKKWLQQIGMLRIIGLLETDFNMALKIYARWLMHRAKTNRMTDKQWGRRKDR